MNRRPRSEFVPRGDSFDTFFKAAVVVWCIGAVVSLAVLGLVIWGVILLFGHFGVLG